MKLARIDHGVVVEIVVIPAGFAAAECFAPEIAAALVPCDDTVAEGMAWDGTAFGPAQVPLGPLPVSVRIAALEARTIRPLGDALLYRAEGRIAEAEAEEARIVDLRRQIADLRRGLVT